ncbi:PucR family transcriptional regulator [Arthrobacter sp. 35W]|uniref:PucR family transcriptional regulator n=1 Tax=Arthrobacter sp. 35W TaxID=1132441 RepID=UPI0018CAC80F|nr:helix-turn-helix domain-containing protein [Arthrobacter sp. 35W]
MLEDLGTTLLELVCGNAEGQQQIETVIIHDSLDEAIPSHGALVLGVGMSETEEIVELLATLATQDAAGLVLRAPVSAAPAIIRASEESGIPVLALTRGASWAQLTSMLRSLIAEGDVGESGLGGMPAGDLFSLVNAISTLLNAPVTIEDRNSRVVAFSGKQDEADPARVETILGRQVPQRYLRQLEQRGVFRELYRSTDPIQVAAVDVDAHVASYPRVALAVRAGDEILGSIWVSVREPMPEDRIGALKDAAKLVALHMLRIRAGADVERRLRADLLATLLEGGTGAADAASRLRLTGHRCVVLALAAADSEEDEEGGAARARLLTARQRIADALSMHLGAVYPRSAAALIGNIVYGVVCVRADQADADRRAARVAKEFLARTGGDRRLLLGIGTIAEDHAALPTSRVSADRALRVLQLGRSHAQLVIFDDVQVESLLVELGDLAAARGDRPSGPVARLLEYDRARNAHLVETLRAWLDAFGDIGVASALVYTHPNTFRYRLRRLSAIGEIDLNDPEARFAAMIQLRLLS